MTRPATSRHAPAKMTREHNRVMAFSKVDVCPLDKLTRVLVESIARTHKVPIGELEQRIGARRAREAGHG
jgi:hypothetical protein